MFVGSLFCCAWLGDAIIIVRCAFLQCFVHIALFIKTNKKKNMWLFLCIFFGRVCGRQYFSRKLALPAIVVVYQPKRLQKRSPLTSSPDTG